MAKKSKIQFQKAMSLHTFPSDIWDITTMQGAAFPFSLAAWFHLSKMRVNPMLQYRKA